MNTSAWMQIMSGERQGADAAVARCALAVLSIPYRGVMALRNKAYDLKILRAQRLPRPVISIGNLTTGGTGKTPMVIELARTLIDSGVHPAVLMRGYKGDLSSGDDGDEARVYRSELGPDAVVVANPDRVRGAIEALRQAPGVGAFLLDDAFQHRKVIRDLDVVLIDATRPWGYGAVLPRGLLRETAQSLKRAHVVIVTRCEAVNQETLAQVDREIESFRGAPADAHVEARWGRLRLGSKSVDEFRPLSELSGKKLTAICGIGNPDPFLKAAEALAGQTLAGTKIFDDHDTFASSDELHAFLDEQKKLGVEACITTEKDWVKWAAWPATSITTPPVYRPTLNIHWRDGRDVVMGHVMRACVPQPLEE